MTRLPSVSVLIPARNEAPDIAGCVEAVGRQRSESARAIEAILIDDRSTDDTVRVAMEAARRTGLELRIFQCAQPGRSAALNAGLGASDADLVVRVDARSRISPDHVERCARVLTDRPNVGVVGGGQHPASRSASSRDRGIARALGNRYSTGWSRYRLRKTAGEADTVWLGAFRRTELLALGGWDESLSVNEDYELNQRFRAAGHLVWFEPDLGAAYLPRRAISAIALQHHRFGRTKGERWANGDRPERRHLLLLTCAGLTVLALLAVGRRRPAAATSTTAACLLAVDHFGSDNPASLAERLWSAVAIATYGAAWTSGVGRGFLGSARRQRSLR